MKNLFSYLKPIIIAVIIMAIAIALYINSSFSSVQQSLVALQQLPSVEKVTFNADQNSLKLRCTSGKEVSIKLEDTLAHYEPIIVDMCR
ncbi:hypothetical protein GF369_02875 [Candidatus Peregrinibacteria bacterium]|nr:hypothetical protein [Candidatus Peregrinibacteria bacterium]